MRDEFQSHILNLDGLAKAKALGAIFSEALTSIEAIVPAGRERALVVTNLQYAAFFASRGMALQPANQLSDSLDEGPPPHPEELEVIALLSAYPKLMATPEGDKAFWLITDLRLRNMYSSARAGVNSFAELAVIFDLPEEAAKYVASGGRYSDISDPKAMLVVMTSNLVVHATTIERDLASRTAEDSVVRLLARLAQAERRGDRDQVAEIMTEIENLKGGK